jgi:type IV pilus assembly protein PilB
MARSDFRLGEILVKKGLISQENLDNALGFQRRSRTLLGTILVEMGFIDEKELYEALSEQFGLELVSISNLEIDWELVEMFPKSLILEHRCFPVSKTEDTLIVGVDNPLDPWVVSEAEKHAKHYQIKRVLVLKREMDTVLEKYRQYTKDKLKKFFGKSQ